MNFKRCPSCDTILVSLYCRDGAGGKVWVKINEKYCKNCKKIMLSQVKSDGNKKEMECVLYCRYYVNYFFQCVLSFDVF